MNLMEAREAKHGPLGLLVENFLKERNGLEYARAYNNWISLLHIMFSTTPDPRREDFINSLSGPQHRSLYLLVEWWSAGIQNQKMSEIIHAIISFPASLEKSAPVSGNCPEPHSITKARSLASKYGYYRELSLLWQAEFLRAYETVDDEYITTLQRHRHDAALVASCQRTSWHIFQSLLEMEDLDIPPVPASMASSPSFNYSGLRINTSMVTEPCPWLNLRARSIANRGSKRDLPLYLWDIQNGCTVETQSLNGRANYTVISHTWGRWIIKEAPPVKVEGVRWPVPRNHRFDAQKLPDILRNMDIATPYAWLDLLCIPQDRSDPSKAMAYNTEIDRQAIIFGSADAGFVWLNDVSSWSGLTATIHWLCLVYLAIMHPCAKEMLGSRTDSIIHAAWSRTGLLGEAPSQGEPSGWFSSLWTLQEICLRPHMGLLDRQGKTLSFGGSTGTLDQLLALCLWVRLKIGDARAASPSSTPRGPMELFRINDMFQLSFLFDMNPMKVLGLANQRYCKHSRARAIMSAIGATTWWSDHVRSVGTPPSEDKLVLGRFPLAFICDIRRQIGASFFATVSQVPEHNDIRLAGDGDRRFGYTVIGSMLPFSSRSDRTRGTHLWGRELHDHPAVRGWRICMDGCVEISEVGIIAARTDPTRSSSGGSLRAAIAAPRTNGELEVQYDDLVEWINKFESTGDIYAVCLCYGGPRGQDWGVILQDVPLRTDERGPRSQLPKCNLLVKIGTYILQTGQQNSQPVNQNVNWVVL